MGMGNYELSQQFSIELVLDLFAVLESISVGGLKYFKERARALESMA